MHGSILQETVLVFVCRSTLQREWQLLPRAKLTPLLLLREFTRPTTSPGSRVHPLKTVRCLRSRWQEVSGMQNTYLSILACALAFYSDIGRYVSHVCLWNCQVWRMSVE